MRKFLGILALLAIICFLLPGAVSQTAYYDGDGVNEGEVVLTITLVSPNANGWRQQLPLDPAVAIGW